MNLDLGNSSEMIGSMGYQSLRAARMRNGHFIAVVLR
jgi:hypothetical protein